MDSVLLIGIGLIALSMLLLIMEAFIPSAGILGLLSLCSAVSGIVFLYRYDGVWGTSGLLLTLILAPMAFFGAMNILPNTAIGRTMVGPSGEEIAEEKDRELRAMHSERSKIVNQTGTALTPMLPGGVILVGDERFDAIAQGEMIEQGQEVRVVSVNGMTITVQSTSTA